LAAIGTGFATIMARLTSMIAAIVVVAVCTGAHGGRYCSEPGRRTGQALCTIGASQTFVITDTTFLVHAIIIVSWAAYTVLVDIVKHSLPSRVTALTLNTPQTAITTMVTPHACHSQIIVIVPLGTGTPS